MFLLDLEGKTLKSEIHCLPIDAFLSFGTDQEQHLRMYVASVIPVTNNRTVTAAATYADILDSSRTLSSEERLPDETKVF